MDRTHQPRRAGLFARTLPDARAGARRLRDCRPPAATGSLHWLSPNAGISTEPTGRKALFCCEAGVKNPELTQARLRELLRYDPDTGDFLWLADNKAYHAAGDIAGCRIQSDYWRIRVDGRYYRAHQL